jgi:hypothetical protein
MNDIRVTEVIGAMTVSAFAERVGLTVDELAARAFDGKQITIQTGESAGESPSWNVRTAEGREALDLAVLEAITTIDDPRGSLARTIREQVGGDAGAIQIRTALNRLIAEDHVSFAGTAAATRYKLLAAGKKRLEASKS